MELTTLQQAAATTINSNGTGTNEHDALSRVKELEEKLEVQEHRHQSEVSCYGDI